MSFPPGTEMFQFPGFASQAYEFSLRSPCGGVSPFGHPRINDRSHLPAAFRSVPRPSSPSGAKASTERPCHTHSHSQSPPPARRTKPRHHPSQGFHHDRPLSRQQRTYTHNLLETLPASPAPSNLTVEHAQARQKAPHQIRFTFSKNMPTARPRPGRGITCLREAGTEQDRSRSRHHFSSQPTYRANLATWRLTDSNR